MHLQGRRSAKRKCSSIHQQVNGVHIKSNEETHSSNSTKPRRLRHMKAKGRGRLAKDVALATTQ